MFQCPFCDTGNVFVLPNIYSPPLMNIVTIQQLLQAISNPAAVLKPN